MKTERNENAENILSTAGKMEIHFMIKKYLKFLFNMQKWNGKKS